MFGNVPQCSTVVYIIGGFRRLGLASGAALLIHVLFDSRLYVPCRREVGKYSSIAIGMASETIPTYMVLRAGMIGQQRHSTSSQSYSAC